MEILTVATAMCSTCRAPLNENGECIACLLRGGLGDGADENGSFGFGDFEIARREDGSLWE